MWAFLKWLIPEFHEQEFIKEHRNQLIEESKALSNKVVTQSFDLIDETQKESRRVNREMIPINQLLDAMDRRRHD